MRVTGKLLAAVVGPGFVIKPGPITGEMESIGDSAIVVPVKGGRRIAIPVSRFAYYEDAARVPELSQEERERALMVKAVRQGKNPALVLEEWRRRNQKGKAVA